jgi:YgiT-type zinc finger domain-containing protein
MGTRFQKETLMKCVVCKHGETQSGRVTVILERDSLTLVVKGVPARVCDNCGEEYTDEQVTERLLETAEEMVRAGTHVDIRDYVAA